MEVLLYIKLFPANVYFFFLKSRKGSHCRHYRFSVLPSFRSCFSCSKHFFTKWFFIFVMRII